MTAMTGKVALITGAAGAIGTATAALLARQGARVVAADLAGADWTALRAAVPDARILTVDVTDEASVAAMVADTGRIDVFFNNAGVEGPIAPIADYPLDAFRTVLAVNVDGVFLGLKYVLPVMLAQGSGAVINTSSVAGLGGAPGMAGYVASKHAVVGLTRVAALEVAGRGVRVNCVNPGPISGRMMASIDTGAGSEEAKRATAIPQQRYGRAEEVAAVVAFLASDAAAYVNGAAYTVDGALTAS
ncbi:oxidoreductase [Sphingomonas sp. Leaf412]|uniref:SDR family NAD(P)-dependent oxidoreductase n=1 Tax=Sphingomonas sp. Leaf412 TaxID=1736370 RepID=UPI0006FAC8DA|nr:SDR family oxidoreductase [Sphingomonas sp. Leaf412]KQT31735.1 oxidoreductase [Sphingomonas sp. Leaf412]